MLLEAYQNVPWDAAEEGPERRRRGNMEIWKATCVRVCVWSFRLQKIGIACCGPSRSTCYGHVGTHNENEDVYAKWAFWCEIERCDGQTNPKINSHRSSRSICPSTAHRYAFSSSHASSSVANIRGYRYVYYESMLS